MGTEKGKMIRKITDFIKSGIWQKGDDEYKNKKTLWAVRQARVIIYTVRGINEHNIIVRSAALTFYTLMSLVPIAALIFGVMKGFGLDTNLSSYLYTRFPEYKALIDSVLTFAENMLLRTKGSIVAITGLVVLFWAVVRVFGNIESAFNTIWEIKKSRSLARKFSDYIAVIFVVPLLWVSSSGIILYIRNQIAQYSYIPQDLLYGFGSLAALWLLLTFVYYMLPNTKVRLRNAALAGVVAGTAFQIFQIAYVYIQSSVSSYNIIYGSFAALPLFLIWLQVSWQIVLLGAELSFAYQNIDRYMQEKEAMLVSYDDRRKVTLAAMIVVLRNFIGKRSPVTSEIIATTLKLPLRIVKDVIYDLENAGLLLTVKSDKNEKVNLYVPALDPHCIRVSDVIYSTEHTGTRITALSDDPDLKSAVRILDNIGNIIADSDENTLLIDLIDNENYDNRERQCCRSID